MADVNIQHTDGGRGMGAVWAVVLVVLLALAAWWFFGTGRADRTADVDVDINTPAAPAAPAAPATTPPPAGGTTP